MAALITEMLSQCKSLKLLYVEDNKTIAKNTAELLRPFFLSITMAYNGLEGLEAYEKDNFDIILTDVMMPELNGTEMSKRIRKINPEQSIIVMSAFESTENFREFIEIGISKFIAKPFQLEHLFKSFIDTAIHINNAKKVALLTNELFLELKEAQKIAKLGSWSLDLKSGKLDFSDEIYELLELDHSIDFLSYQGFMTFVHPEDREVFESTYQNSLDQRIICDHIYRILLPDGRIKYVRGQGENFYDSEGTPSRSRGTIQDVTEQKNLEYHLIEAREAAEGASKVKSDFLANMSHEIRTPLNGVIGLTDLLLKTELTPLQSEYLHKSKIAAKALLGVLNNILDYSKIEVHKFSLEYTMFHLNDILKDIHAMYSYQAEQKRIKFEIDVEDNVPKTLCGDALRLQQILGNLVANALKFTDSGYVRVRVSATNQEGKDKLTFSISDSGIGIRPEEQKKLFQPFSQVDSSSTRQYGGSGLGLMISKELVELMGGEITVDSTIGEGSTFTFTALFRLVCEISTCESVIDCEVKSPQKSQKIHLLLVEDNDLNQLVASERLKQIGITCDIANNGLEAVELFQKAHYDAILMDLQMPVMDGFEATRQIRRLQEGKERCPIIALSAAVLADDLAMARESGMDDHIAKPIDNIIFKTMMKKWFNI